MYNVPYTTRGEKKKTHKTTLGQDNFRKAIDGNATIAREASMPHGIQAVELTQSGMEHEAKTSNWGFRSYCD